MLDGNISNPNIIHGINTINAITTGNNMVQLNNISWSNLIRGKEALTQINTKIIIDDFIPILNPYNNPSIKGSDISVVNEGKGSPAIVQYISSNIKDEGM